MLQKPLDLKIPSKTGLNRGGGGQSADNLFILNSVTD